MNPTGNIRFRTVKEYRSYVPEVLVLQIELWNGKDYVWRDAKVEDLTVVKLERLPLQGVKQ